MAGIGHMKQMVLEKHVSGKTAAGSTSAATTARYAIWGEIDRSGGGRAYEHLQTTLSNTFRVKIYWRTRFDMNAIWKVVYDGRTHAVESIEKVDERRFNYVLIVESKGKR